MISPRLCSAAAAVLALAAAGLFPARAEDPIKPDVGPTRGKEVLIIKESRDAQTFNAEDQDVTVQGDGNKVTIRGTCHALSLTGDHNHVSVASVASIAFSGSSNQVSWSKASGGEKPQITDLGKNNEVAHAAAKD